MNKKDLEKPTIVKIIDRLRFCSGHIDEVHVHEEQHIKTVVR